MGLFKSKEQKMLEEIEKRQMENKKMETVLKEKQGVRFSMHLTSLLQPIS